MDVCIKYTQSVLIASRPDDLRPAYELYQQLGLFPLENTANRRADFFVGSVYAAYPATGATLARTEIMVCSYNTADTSFVELYILDPANPFVSR